MLKKVAFVVLAVCLALPSSLLLLGKGAEVATAAAGQLQVGAATVRVGPDYENPANPDLNLIGLDMCGGFGPRTAEYRENLFCWNTQTPPSSVIMYGVWGVSDSDVFAVGSGGAIWHFNGTSWSTMTSGTTADLYGVWGTSSSNVYAVGAGGKICRYTGSSWVYMNSGTTKNLYGVWGTSATNVYAVGAGGTIRRCTGSSWVYMNSGTTKELRGVWGTSATNVYAVGAGGTIRRYSGSSWVYMNSGTTKNLYGVWGTSASNLFAVGADGTIQWSGGGTWNATDSGVTAELRGICGTSPSNVYVSGASGKMLNWDGVGWKLMEQGTTTAETLYGVWGTSTSDFYAVGSGGKLLRSPKSEICAKAIVVYNGSTKICLVSCDVIAMTEDYLDVARSQIATNLGIPSQNIIVNSTHTHNSPAPIYVHGCYRDEAFCGRLRMAIVKAATLANGKLAAANAYFRCYKLSDNLLNPLEPRPGYEGMDTDFPVLAFRKSGDGSLIALLFSHAAHGNGVYGDDATISPSIYGLAAQELEHDEALGSPTVAFFSGCIGGYYLVGNDEYGNFRFPLIKQDTLLWTAHIRTMLENALSAGGLDPITDTTLGAASETFSYTIRRFDPDTEKRLADAQTIGGGSSGFDLQKGIEIWDTGRGEFAYRQGEARQTNVEGMRIGDVYLAGMPGEMFPYYGQKIKDRLGAANQHRTFTLGLTNDWIGYISDDDGIDNRIYNALTSTHSFADYDSGKRLANRAVAMLQALGGGTYFWDEGPRAHFQETMVVDQSLPAATIKVQFWDQSTSCNGIGQGQWEWDFGDGSAKSHDQNPVHTYTNVPQDNPGFVGHTYTVSLKVTDKHGWWNARTESVLVSYGWPYMTKSDGSGNILLQQDYRNLWSAGWDAVIPGDFLGPDGKTDILRWDKDSGVAELYRGNGAGNLTLVKTYTGVDLQWDEIIPGNFFTANSNTDLMFWDKNTGWAHMVMLSPSTGDIVDVHSFQGWDLGWDKIVPGDFGTKDGATDLLFWDRDGRAGGSYAAIIMKSDGLGNMSYGPLYTLADLGFDEGRWVDVVPGEFNGDQYLDVMFWDKNGNAEMFKGLSTCALTWMTTHTGWATFWDEIVPGDYFPDTSQTDLFFWDKDNQYAYMCRVTGNGVVTDVVDYHCSSWDKWIPGNFFIDTSATDLLLWERQTDA